MLRYGWICVALLGIGKANFVGGADNDMEAPPQQVSLDVENMGLRETLRVLQEKTGLNFIIHPEVKDTLIAAAHFVNQPLETILKLLLSPVEATYEVRKGVFVIVPQTEPAPAPLPAANPSEPEGKAPDGAEQEVAPPEPLPAPRREPEAPAPPAQEAEQDEKEGQAPEIRVLTLNYLRPSVAAWILGGQAIPETPFFVNPLPPIVSQPYYGGYGSYGYNPYGNRRSPGRSRGYHWGHPTAHGTTTTKTWGLLGSRETTTVFGPEGVYTVEKGWSLDPHSGRSGLQIGSDGLSLQLGPLRLEAGGTHIEFPAGF